SKPDPALTAILQHGNAMGAAHKESASLEALAREIEKIDQGTEAVPLDLSQAIMDFPTLLALTIPERTRHVPWLTEGGIVMVYGPRGVGKAFFTLGPAPASTTVW